MAENRDHAIAEGIEELKRQLIRIASKIGIDEPDVDGNCEEPGTPRGRVRQSRAPLPDPRLLRLIIKQRRLRDRFFADGLFSDPAWDMLLDLTAARAEHKRVSVTSLCLASAVPSTTALRWIAELVDIGLVERTADTTDRRRAFVALTDRGADAMARYFAKLAASATTLI
jgi:DNA-binding MarR family transcriptional regulator